MGEENTSVTVLGAGAWGTALAQHLAQHGRHVTLWSRDADILKAIRNEHANPVYLPGVALSADIRTCADLNDATAASEFLVLATPCNAVRQIAEKIKPQISERQQGLVWTCKGFEHSSGKLIHEVLAEALGDALPTACLSGPSFAAEVAAGMPTAVVVASQDENFAHRAAQLFHAGDFRVYPGDDVIGVEVASALKNVIAIAAGISDGLSFGANARAALISRALTEIGRLVKAMGGKDDTLAGLAGVGDMILTCTDDQSRNRRFGLALAGKGEPVDDRYTVEGVMTARATDILAQRYDVELPICSGVAEIIEGKATAKQVVARLLSREMKTNA